MIFIALALVDEKRIAQFEQFFQPPRNPDNNNNNDKQNMYSSSSMLSLCCRLCTHTLGVWKEIINVKAEV